MVLSNRFSKYRKKKSQTDRFSSPAPRLRFRWLLLAVGRRRLRSLRRVRVGLGVIEDAFGVAAAVLETWKNSEKLRKTDGKSGEAWNMIEKSGNVPGLDEKMMGHDGNVCGTLRQFTPVR